MSMMKYDPKLKEAMAKIEAICNEYDCGGYISLTSKTHGEFRFVFPEWSAIKEEFNSNGEAISCRLNCKKEEREKAELTAHFIHSNRDIAAAAFTVFNEFVEETNEKWQTEHKPFHQFRAHRKDEN